MQLVLQGGNDYRKTLVTGVSFWVGVGFQYQAIFPDYLSGALEVLLSNGITAGGLTVVGLTVFLELTGPRRCRLDMELAIAGLPKLTEFLRALAARLGWGAEATQRLCLIGEEALTSLVQQMDAEAAACTKPRLEVRKTLKTTSRCWGSRWRHPASANSRCVCCGHFASSVRHQQYHNIDIVTVRVDGSA